MREGFEAAGVLPAVTLPDAAVEASASAVRPMLAPGGQPVAVVVLLDISVQGMTDA